MPIRGLANGEAEQILRPPHYIRALFICSKVCRVPVLAEQEDEDREVEVSGTALAQMKRAHTVARKAGWSERSVPKGDEDRGRAGPCLRGRGGPHKRAGTG